jgi:hypothetical protein
MLDNQGEEEEMLTEKEVVISEAPRPKVGASWRKSSQLPLRFS